MSVATPAPVPSANVLDVANVEVIYNHVILVLQAVRGEVTKGQIHCRGERVDGLTPNDLVRRGVIQVMEGRHCFGHLTVEENLLTGAFIHGNKRRQIADDLEKVYHYF